MTEKITTTDLIKESLEEIKNSQRTIDKLIEIGTMGITNKKPVNKWTLKPLDNKENCSIGFVYINNIELGPCETHVHSDSIEYLIVVSGSVMLNLDGQNVRKLKIGDCASIEKGLPHFTSPLENNTTMIYICIPEDIGMEKLARISNK